MRWVRWWYDIYLRVGILPDAGFWEKNRIHKTKTPVCWGPGFAGCVLASEICSILYPWRLGVTAIIIFFYLLKYNLILFLICLLFSFFQVTGLMFCIFSINEPFNFRLNEPTSLNFGPPLRDECNYFTNVIFFMSVKLPAVSL